MNIGEVAKLSGVSAKMIRHYEQIGVIPRASRSQAGYRSYSESDAHQLLFVRHARELGFSMEDIALLLGLWRNKRRKSSEVKRLAQSHVQGLKLKIRQLESMVHTLEHLAHCCQGDERPDCPILEGLAQDGEAKSPSSGG